MRNQLYYKLAPQSGQIVQAKKAGIGEILKDGDLIVEIIPDQFDYAVEMYIDPVDQPLMNKGQKCVLFWWFPSHRFHRLAWSFVREHLQVLLPRWKIIQAPMVSFVCWYRKILTISLGRNNYGLAEQQAVLLCSKTFRCGTNCGATSMDFRQIIISQSKDAAAKIMPPS